MRFRIALLCALGALAAATGGIARASVLEINQTCALTGGCFAGDAAGFPVTITQRGAYRLTSNLSIPMTANAKDVSAIDVAVDDMDIDLNGFGLFGTTTCSGSPTTCSPTGQGHGVGSVSGGTGTSVHDGSVVGFGGVGVSLSNGFRVERVHLWNNGGGGLLAFGASGVLRDSAIFGNGGDGAQTFRYAVVTGCVFGQNNHDGLNGRQATQVEESISWRNGRVGFWAEIDLDVAFSVGNDNGNGGLSGLAEASVGAGNTTYGVTAGFPNEAIVKTSVLTGNGSGSWPARGLSLGRNACNGASC
ncbi:MAG TPA: hypothetical protein VGV61_01390 [Thermoanaerobaculia bacterium]|jgi:hypothetical protein|nr:hypothetical protein [Thermoanaerobaculia bacterium]